jgi:hypothetical protein
MSLFKVQLLITALVLVGQTTALLRKKDFFPFSPYAMYSSVYTPEVMTYYKVMAIAGTQEPFQVRISSYFPAFWQALFVESLQLTESPEMVCPKLYSIFEIHQQKYNVKVKSAQIIRYQKKWESLLHDFFQSSSSPTPAASHALVECSF